MRFSALQSFSMKFKVKLFVLCELFVKKYLFSPHSFTKFKRIMARPNYIFEVSWEVCNKTDGIYNVLAGKSGYMKRDFGQNYILIGPDIWKEAKQNPEFDEDLSLFPELQDFATQHGFRIRPGYWHLPESPLVILVDFSAFIAHKDEIFKDFWDKFGLNSLHGQWDYIEPATFGYAVGKTLDGFSQLYFNSETKSVAQFHDWNTGTALLYLKDRLPHIATVFTVHSSIVARTLAQNGERFHNTVSTIDVYAKTLEYGISANHSLEKKASENADILTAISEFSANHCEIFNGKRPTHITPNGYDKHAFFPESHFSEKRAEVAAKLKEVAQAMLNEQLPDDTRFMFTSGLYEYYNKGFGLLTSAFKRLAERKLDTKIVFFILVPSNIYGPRKSLKRKLENNSIDHIGDSLLTHSLHNEDFDPILASLKRKNVRNNPDTDIKIIYVPAFLDGHDEIFNIKYIDLLLGFDLGVFPAYYEPWGYTIQESLASHIPTVTTNTTGIGSWLTGEGLQEETCIRVLERTDDNDIEVIEHIVEIMSVCAGRTLEQRNAVKNRAFQIANDATWDTLLPKVISMYESAAESMTAEPRAFAPFMPSRNKFKQVETFKSNKPVWRTLSVKSEVSGKLQGLEEIAGNLWWAWDYEAVDLFRELSEEPVTDACIDPIGILKKVSYERFNFLEKDDAFIRKYERVYKRFKTYIDTPFDENLPSVAYFSMEYGLANIVKIYSGGLGILAGDYLKQASDSRYNMVGVGLFYRQGYFTQQITAQGEQNPVYESQRFSELPAELIKNEKGETEIVQIAFPGRIINAQIWRVKVGRISLYLLDTDREDNREEDRFITHRLYGGDVEHRLKQEMVLGIGGIRVLQKFDIKQNVYHCNEGHAAFIGFERINYLVNIFKLTFAEALEVVRASTLFTTHTPVPAGHDAFDENMIMTYMGHYPERYGINWQEFVNLGKAVRNKAGEEFSMSVLAANISQEINGVSRLHGDVTKRDIFPTLWEGYFPEELHIGYVTNGVHDKTWTSKDWQTVLADSDGSINFKKINELSDLQISDIRKDAKIRLINFIRSRFDDPRIMRSEDPKFLVQLKNALNPDALTIGFARRFATYKRGKLLFTDIERLKKIVNNAERPVQFLFAGKAHPADKGGQAIIKEITEISKRPEFLGKVLFLENYNMNLAKELVQGVDIWMNTPTRPLEASGTSGMKAVMNGVMNFSVLDGWWVEGYKEGAGWALPEKRSYDNQEMQDNLDAEMIYQIFENEIIPLYYDQDENGISKTWIQYIRKCVAEIAPEFTTKRMIDDYQARFYGKLQKRTLEIRDHNFKKVKEIAAWKRKFASKWNDIEVVELHLSDPVRDPLVPGEKYYGELVLDIKDLSPEYLGVEMVITQTDIEGHKNVIKIEKLEYEKSIDGKAHYSIVIKPTRPGNYDFAFRMFPLHNDLPHRQDFAYVRWI